MAFLDFSVQRDENEAPGAPDDTRDDVNMLLLECEEMYRTETPELLVYAGSYIPPPPEVGGPLDKKGWNDFFRRQMAGTSIVVMMEHEEETNQPPPLELFVSNEDLNLNGFHEGIPVGPALAGWIETLHLPKDIKDETCRIFRHKNNRTVMTSGNIGDTRQDTIRQFVTLLQQMYKLKMSGESLAGLHTLMPVFLLLANKL